MSLIGNKYELAFDLIPVRPSWETRYQAESVAWAGLAIWVDGENLCSHVVHGTSQVREHLFIPVAPLADWLVRSFPALEFEERAPLFPTDEKAHASIVRWGDTAHPDGVDEDRWIDEREQWWSRHFLAAGSDGARVPNIAFVRSDEQLVIDWARPRLAERPPLAMLYPEGRVAVDWNDGRAALEGFVNLVADWIRETEAVETFPWARTRSPLPTASMEEALELFTGHGLNELRRIFRVDDYERLIASLELVGQSDPAAAPQCQMLRDASPSLTNDEAEAVREVGGRSAREDPEARDKWIAMREIALDAARSTSRIEDAGYVAAGAVRRSVGLDGRPIADVADLLRSGGVDYRHLEGIGSRHDRMLVGVRSDGAPAASTFETPRLSAQWARNFEEARALGHLLLDPIRAGAIGAASGPFSQATRRRRSGAFAAELLLPATAIERESGHRLDGATENGRFQQILEKYGIGASAAAFQLWNQGWLSSESVRDDLVEQHASLL